MICRCGATQNSGEGDRSDWGDSERGKPGLAVSYKIPFDVIGHVDSIALWLLMCSECSSEFL